MRILKTLVNLLGAIVLLYIVASTVIFLFFTSETNVKFQSSDKEWADSEVIFKGRNFESILFYFHLYKLKCNKPNVQLQRLTDKPNWYQIEHWLNDYDDLKWQVPLGEGNANTNSGYYPKVSENHCNNRGVKQEVWEQVDKQVQDYLDQLSQTHNNTP